MDTRRRWTDGSCDCNLQPISTQSKASFPLVVLHYTASSQYERSTVQCYWWTIGWGGSGGTGQQEQHTWCSGLQERAPCTGHKLDHQAPPAFLRIHPLAPFLDDRNGSRKGHHILGKRKGPAWSPNTYLLVLIVHIYTRKSLQERAPAWSPGTCPIVIPTD